VPLLRRTALAAAVSLLVLPSAATAEDRSIEVQLRPDLVVGGGQPGASGTLFLTASTDGPIPGGALTTSAGFGNVAYIVTGDGVSLPASAHLHRGERGEVGPVVADLEYQQGGMGAETRGVVVDQALAREIFDHPERFYIDVHGNGYAAGSMRAQLGGFQAAPMLPDTGYPKDYEPLVFELTLTGDIDSADTFGVSHECLDGDEFPECHFIEDLSIFCTGIEAQRESWGYPECRAGTFLIEYERRPGWTIAYALLRHTAGEEGFRDYLPGEVTVPAGGTTVHLGWDTSFGQAEPPTVLPDTAVAPSEDALP
jgi:CHRD domain